MLLYFIDKEPREFQHLDCPGKSLLWGNLAPNPVLSAASLWLDARGSLGLPCWAGSDRGFVPSRFLEGLPSLSYSARLGPCWCLSCRPQPGEGEAGGRRTTSSEHQGLTEVKRSCGTFLCASPTPVCSPAVEYAVMLIFTQFLFSPIISPRTSVPTLWPHAVPIPLLPVVLEGEFSQLSLA